jgi:hypothetical protein
MAPAIIRPARASDLASVLQLAAAHRSQYEAYQPIFWRPAPGAIDRQRPYLAKLIDDDAVITVVADTGGGLAGFAVGVIGEAPAVYDPGGATCVIDDFTVDVPGRWPTVGVELFRAVRRAAREQGATQVVVVCGHLDGPKRDALKGSGLNIASEWWVGPLGTD